MYNNSIPNNQVYRYNNSMSNNQNYMYSNYRNNDDRNPLLPFLVGGVAGGALGYGIANNNFLANQPRPWPMYPQMPCCGQMFMPYRQPFFGNFR